MKEKFGVSEQVNIEKSSVLSDKLSWRTKWVIEKFEGSDIEGKKPYAIEVVNGNLAVNTGLQLLEDLLIGVPSVSASSFNNANAHIGVGNSNTSATASQTDLVGTNVRKAMEATFPSRSGQTLSFKSVFGTSDANFAWEEFGIFNASSSGTMLNRKVESKGTKTSADTWTITLQISIS